MIEKKLHSQILESNYVVHDYCTTGLEAALLGKKTFHFKNNLFKNLEFSDDPFIYSTPINNYKLFKNYLNQIKNDDIKLREISKKKVSQKNLIKHFDSYKKIPRLISNNIKMKRTI